MDEALRSLATQIAVIAGVGFVVVAIIAIARNVGGGCCSGFSGASSSTTIACGCPGGVSSSVPSSLILIVPGFVCLFAALLIHRLKVE